MEREKNPYPPIAEYLREIMGPLLHFGFLIPRAKRKALDKWTAHADATMIRSNRESN